MQAYIGAELPRILLVPDELVVALVVVVCLVVVVAVGLPVGIIAHHAAGVIRAPIQALFILRGVVPCMVRLFDTVPGDELHHRVVAKPSALQEIGVQFGGGAVQVTLRTDV